MSELRPERLVLREWRDGDRDAWAAMNADPEVVSFTSVGNLRSRAVMERHPRAARYAAMCCIARMHKGVGASASPGSVCP